VAYHAPVTLSSATVVVEVPATSANLGPGFDSFGVAFEVYDKVTARIGGRGVHVKVTGEGAGDLPTDKRHLIADVMLDTFDQFGERPSGIQLDCQNQIPQARGLGSSSAATVAGILLAREFLEGGPSLLDEAAVIRQAAKREGHPDNVAPCVLGGFTVAWTDPAASPDDSARAVRIENASGIVPVIFVPVHRGFTAQARALLPARVPLADAAFNAARAAMLLLALTGSPELLYEATEDRLHQIYRAKTMPETARFLQVLRDMGIPAVVSGAGPSVLALVPEDKGLIDDAKRQCPEGWYEQQLKIDKKGAKVRTADKIALNAKESVSI
jgi:homoserine kinase